MYRMVRLTMLYQIAAIGLLGFTACGSSPDNPAPSIESANDVPDASSHGVFIVRVLPTGEVAQVDPILAPGGASPHTHVFFGATNVTPTSRRSELLAGSTTAQDLALVAAVAIDVGEDGLDDVVDLAARGADPAGQPRQAVVVAAGVAGLEGPSPRRASDCSDQRDFVVRRRPGALRGVFGTGRTLSRDRAARASWAETLSLRIGLVRPLRLRTAAFLS